jgi:lysophospholipase L1-like esterase
MKCLNFILTGIFLFQGLEAYEIAIVGDSISSVNCAMIPYEKCYPYLLEKELKELGYQTDIINISVGGTNTYGALDQLTYLFKYHHPDIVVLEFGFNDIFRNIALSETKKNFEKMISMCLLNNCKVFIGRIDLSSWYPFLSLDYINSFNSLFTSFEEKYPEILFNFLNNRILNNSKYHIGDHCHPNAKGHTKILETLKRKLIPYLDELIMENTSDFISLKNNSA